MSGSQLPANLEPDKPDGAGGTLAEEDCREVLLDVPCPAAPTGDQSGAEPPVEVDIARIARPHLFHAREVSGLLVPVAQVQGNSRIEGKWRLHLQWANGRREYIDLRDYLDVSHGDRIWFSLIPPAPSTSTPARWSRAGRAKWRNGHTPDLKELFEHVLVQFLEYLEFPPEDNVATASTLTLWTLLTYAFPVWSAVPYLCVGGPLGSGKSRVLDVLAQLVFNPISSSNMTAACLFRTLDVQGGTLLLDEAERLWDRTPDMGDLRSILLAGYRRGGQATRVERVGNNFKSISFDVYGPKAIAGISGLPPALASRCIPILMFRAGKDSPVSKRQIDPAAKVWSDLRDHLHGVALAYGRHFLEVVGWQPGCQGLGGRDRELWQPILALAKLVEEAGMEGLVETVEQYALKSIVAGHEDNVPEGDEILLLALKRLLQDRPRGVTASEVLTAAREEERSLFTCYTPRGVAAVFKRYGIKSHRTGGRRLYDATDAQWKTIQESYGINLGSDGSEGGTDGTQ